MIMRHLLLLVLIGSCLSAGPATHRDHSVDEESQSLLTKWRPRLERERLNYLVSPPYVVAGDGSRLRLESYRDRTILAATRALQASFFKNKPTQPILILLFESAEPYQRLSKKWFD